MSFFPYIRQNGYLSHPCRPLLKLWVIWQGRGRKPELLSPCRILWSVQLSRVAFPHPSTSWQSPSGSRSPPDSGHQLLWSTRHCSKLRNHGAGGGLWHHSHNRFTQLRFGAIYEEPWSRSCVFCPAHCGSASPPLPAYKGSVLEKWTQIIVTVLVTLLYIWNPLPASVPVNTEAIGCRRVFLTALAVLCCSFSLSGLNYCNLLHCQVQDPPPAQLGSINTRKGNGESQMYLSFN